MSPVEKQSGARVVPRISDDCLSCEVVVPYDSHQMQDSARTFTLDRMFPSHTSQETVYNYCGSPLVDKVLAGYNGTIFAYGQTGSGKTYTMEGDVAQDSTKGVIPRMVEEIFGRIQQADTSLVFTIKVSFVEIYMERIKDLLDPNQPAIASKSPDTVAAIRKRCRQGNQPRIRENAEQGVFLEDVSEPFVGCLDDFMECLHKGNIHRAVSATRMNLNSSRSHAVVTLQLVCQSRRTGTKKTSKLMMVDLAGSEKTRKTKSSGARLEEAKQINKSLTTLGLVIHSLTEAKSHIPYRNSKLTRLLSDSLGGNSHTCLIVTCSPASHNIDETVSTLRFGQRAKTIKNKPKVNKVMSVDEYKQLLTRAKKRIQKQESIIIEMTEEIRQCSEIMMKNGICISDYMPKSTYFHMGDRYNRPGGGRLRQIPEHPEKGAPPGQNSVAGSEDDLHERIIELTEAKEQLIDELADLKSDYEIEQQSTQTYKAQLDELQRKLTEADVKSKQLAEHVGEYKFYKQKLELVETEHAFQKQLHEEEVTSLKEKLLRKTSKASSELRSGGKAGSPTPTSTLSLDQFNPSRIDFTADPKTLAKRYREVFQALAQTANEKREVQEQFSGFKRDIQAASQASGDDRELIARLLYQNREVSKKLVVLLDEKDRLMKQVVMQSKTAEYNEALRKNWQNQLTQMEQAVLLGNQIRARERSKFSKEMAEKDSELARLKIFLSRVTRNNLGLKSPKKMSSIRPPCVSVPVRRIQP